MKRTTCLTCFGSIIAVLAFTAGNAAQCTSTADIYGLSMKMNADFWRGQADLDRTIKQGEKLATPSSPSTPNEPGTPQWYPPVSRLPITATDFHPASRREVPELFLKAMSDVPPQQKAALGLLYHNILMEYEKRYRGSNVALAVVYAVEISLRIDRGTTFSPAQRDHLVWFLNDAFGGAVQFQALTAQQKQIVYESLVICGGMAAALYAEGRDQRNPDFQAQARLIAQSILKQWAGM